MNHFHVMLHSYLCDVRHCGGIDGSGFLAVCFRLVYCRVGSTVNQILYPVVGHEGINLKNIGDIQRVSIGEKETEGQVHAGSYALISLPSCPLAPVTSTFFCTSP